MGMFQIYRIAGGEAGMRHFMAQFGPCLKWPWTKLMDVPEFNDELVDLIADAVGRAVARPWSIRELERIRDDNLVAHHGSAGRSTNKGKGWGAGELLQRLCEAASAKLGAAKAKAEGGEKAAEERRLDEDRRCRRPKATVSAGDSHICPLAQRSEPLERQGGENASRARRRAVGIGAAMDFGLTDEQKLIVETTRAFVENELYPHEAEVERTGVLRPELIEELQAKAIAAGLYAANMPEDVGGAGLDTLTWLLYEKELGRANYALHWTCVARPSNILLAGTPEQREKYLFPCIRGEKWDCLAMTEPGAGSDLRGMKATAVQDGDDWVLNGTKHFISHADIADFAIVFMASGEEETPRGKTQEDHRLLRRQGHAGLHRARRLPQRLASRLHQRDPRIRRLPAAGKRRSSARCTRASRSPIPGSAPRGCRSAATCLGRAERALGHAIDYAAQRKQFGQQIGKFQGVSFKLADMAMEIKAADLLTLRGRLEIRPGHRDRPGHGHGQAEGHRDAGLRRRRGDPDPWRHGPDGRPAAGAHLARRARRAHLGRHQRDPAPHHQRALLGLTARLAGALSGGAMTASTACCGRKSIAVVRRRAASAPNVVEAVPQDGLCRRGLAGASDEGRGRRA